MIDYRLDGRRALVGGASRGIGRAVATALAEQGAQVTLLARDRQRLAQACAELPAPAQGAHDVMEVDLAEPAALQAELSQRVQSGARYHVLINNSGGPPAGAAHTAETREFTDAFRQHLISAQIILQELLPGMRDAGYGRVINVISTSVKEPITGLGVSNTVRGAVASWAKTLATELGPHGITVNNVLPGFTDTERLGYLFGEKARKSGRTPDAVLADALAGVPLGRLAHPDEIAAAVAFLASPAASFVSGINLPVDGGRTRSL